MKTEWLRSEILRRTNCYKEAFMALRTSDSLNNINFAKRINTDLSSAVVNHYNLLNRANKAELKASHILLWLIVVVSISVILFFICGVVIYRKRKEAIIEQNVLIAQDLRNLLQVKDKEFSVAKKSIHSLLMSKFEIFDQLCQAIYENPNSAVVRRRISEMIDHLITDITNNPKKIEELESYINIHYSNLMADFRSEFPNLKEIDYRLFLFTMLGFSTSSISVLINEPRITSIYDRKRRLKDKIKHSSIPNYQRYLEVL